MTACIYYHPEAYTTSGPKLMGRNAAGEAFLRAWLMHARTDQWWVMVQRPEHAQAFADTARRHGRQEPVRAVQLGGLGHLAQVGALVLPGPGLAGPAQERSIARPQAGSAAWSLFGLTHTTASAGVMDELAVMPASAVQPWDALVCTSQAVKANVLHLLQAQEAELAHRLGATRFARPQLPVIPLGVHTGDFSSLQAGKAAARQALGVGEQDAVVLFTGRLSFHAKAHPLAMYQALEQAAQRVGGPVTLIECGWHANDYIARAFEQAAAQACPHVRVLRLDGRVAEQRQRAWAAADVFCSLSDNVQETFGLTPVEAMACGLPSVVTDWDGYRDTVRHGVDGFLIPTTMPAPGLGEDLAQRHALGIDTYDAYCGHSCMFVAVDVPAAAQAFERLLRDPALRSRMGAAARQRAQEVYDWRVVIAQYEALWADMAAQRQQAAGHPGASARLHRPWPARPDPFTAFAAYPTQALRGATLLTLQGQRAQALGHLQQCLPLTMVGFADRVTPALPRLQALVQAMPESGPCALADLQQRLGWTPHEAQRAVALLLKLNVLALAPKGLGNPLASMGP
jgi:glycosyltransferase involved in cell wall biosynthesis